jgi:hypothetical protein
MVLRSGLLPDVGPLLEPGGDKLGLVTGCTILEEVVCPALHHEELQLLIKNTVVPRTICHLPLLQKLQGSPAPLPEATLGHDLGRVFDSLCGELEESLSEPTDPPRVGKSELKMVFIAEHHLLTVHYPPPPPHSGTDGLRQATCPSWPALGGPWPYLPCGQTEVLHAQPVDGPDKDVLQGR